MRNPFLRKSRANVPAIDRTSSLRPSDSTPNTDGQQTILASEKMEQGQQVSNQTQPVLGEGSTQHVQASPLPPDAGEKTVEMTPVAEAKALEKIDEEPEYPKGLRLAVITASLCFSVLLMALDNTIVATAIPTITNHFRALDDVGWYGSAYLLTTCAFQLFFGKLYSFFSIKYVYLIAILIFEVGSALCGAAPTSNALIVGRAIAGVGSAGIFSGALIIIAYSVPLRQRGAYTGIIGGVYGLASVISPVLGGALTDHASWRWCFYINLPIGALTMLGIAIFYHSPARRDTSSMGFWNRTRQFDPYGTLVFIPCVVCLLLALQWGGTKYPWKDGRIIALLVIFGVLAVVFAAIQMWQQENATVPPRILSQRTVASSAWFSLCLGASFFIFVYYIPLWFQTAKSSSATTSGLQILPTVLGLVVMSIIAGFAVTIFGYYTPFMLGSSVLMAIGAGLISTFQVDTGHSRWIGYQVLYGLGVGMGMQQSLMAVQTVLPLQDVPIGTSIINLCLTLGGALFIGIAQNIFTNRLSSELIAKVPRIPSSIVLNTGATSLKDVVLGIDPSSLRAVLEAYNHALVGAFYVSVALACASILGSSLVEWRSVKGKKIEQVAV